MKVNEGDIIMGRKKQVVDVFEDASKKVSTECVSANKKNVKTTKSVKVSDNVIVGDVSTECSSDKLKSKSGRRGRPKKLNVEKVSTECSSDFSSNARMFKFLGYCSNPICNGFLSDGDFVNINKNLVKCIRCGEIQNISDLLLEKKTDKELFDNSRNVVDIDYDIEDYSNSLPEDFSDLANNYKDDWE